MSWQEELKEFRKTVATIKQNNPDWGRRKIAKHLGCSASKVGRALVYLKKNYEDQGSVGTAIERDFKERNGYICVQSLNIRTAEDALEIADIDTDIWEVERQLINSWEVTNKYGERFTNFQVKVWLKRKSPELKSIELVIKDLQNNPPKLKRVKYKNKNKHLLEIAMYDVHLGLLAWGKEVGEDHDAKIGREIYRNAIIDSTRNVPNTIEEILFPLGQDFFHINNPRGMTPKAGNVLDVDSRLAYIYEQGEYAVIEGIEHCRQIAPVRVLWVPGNHDPETSFYLCRTIDAWFRNDPNVIVDVNPTFRKYHRYGVNLIGFTHGDEEPHKSLPTIMADEKPNDWAETKIREWHTGHTHRQKKMDFLSVDTIGSVVVRVLPSMTGTDFWHYMKGYVGGNKITQSFLWNKEDGLENIFFTYVRRD